MFLLSRVPRTLTPFKRLLNSKSGSIHLCCQCSILILCTNCPIQPLITNLGVLFSKQIFGCTALLFWVFCTADMHREIVYPEGINNDAKDLISKFLTLDPFQRLGGKTQDYQTIKVILLVIIYTLSIPLAVDSFILRGWSPHFISRAPPFLSCDLFSSFSGSSILPRYRLVYTL